MTNRRSRGSLGSLRTVGFAALCGVVTAACGGAAPGIAPANAPSPTDERTPTLTSDAAQLPPDGDLDPALCDDFLDDEAEWGAEECRLLTLHPGGIRAVHIYTDLGGDAASGFSAVLFEGRWVVLREFAELVSVRHGVAITTEEGDIWNIPTGESEMNLVAHSLRSGRHWVLAACAAPSMAPDGEALACRGPLGQLYRTELPDGGRVLVGEPYDGPNEVYWYAHWDEYQPPARFLRNGRVRYEIHFELGDEPEYPPAEVHTVEWPGAAP